MKVIFFKLNIDRIKLSNWIDHGRQANQKSWNRLIRSCTDTNHIRL